MKTVIVRESGEFKKLEKDWNQLLSESRNNNIFLTFDWQFNWWQHFGKNYHLFIILVYNADNRLVGIMPLMMGKICGLRQLTFIGKPLSDYEDILICEGVDNKQEIIGSMFKALEGSSGWDLFKLSRLGQDSSFFSAFKERPPVKTKLKSVLNQHKEGAPYLRIRGCWDEYCSGLKNKFIADTKRQAARLSQQYGLLTLKKIVNPQEVDEYLDKLAEFHRLRRKAKRTKSIFDNPETCNFIKLITKAFLEKGWLDLSVLQNNSTIAAINLGFNYKNKAYYYIPAFNDGLRQYSVGRLLLYELLRSCFSGHMFEFDFMLGEEDYKHNWNAEVKNLYFINIYPRTIRGKIANFIFSFLNISIKKILKKNW